MHLRTEALELSLSCKIIKNKADIQRWQRTRIVLNEDDLWQVAIISNENKASGLTCKHTVANYTPDDINVYTISYIILHQTAPNINTKAATNLTHRLLQNCTPSYSTPTSNRAMARNCNKHTYTTPKLHKTSYATFFMNQHRTMTKSAPQFVESQKHIPPIKTTLPFVPVECLRAKEYIRCVACL